MILSIDGSYILHRARFIAEKNEEVTRDNIVLLFMRSLLTTLDKFTPTKIYVYFDRGRSVHRREILPAYKAQRIKDPNCPVQQTYDAARDFLCETMPDLGIITVLEDGIEADDFAYLVASESAPGVHVSDDKDWFLNLFPDWHLFRAKANELHSYGDLCKLVNDDKNPRLVYLITRALVGDKSDNIPGVRGFGWETAVKFAYKIINKEDLGTGAKAKVLEKHMDIVRRNMSLMNPSWILSSDEAKEILTNAELRVKVINNPLLVWREFSGQINECGSELMVWWNKYNRIIRGINQ